MGVLSLKLLRIESAASAKYSPEYFTSTNLATNENPIYLLQMGGKMAAVGVNRSATILILLGCLLLDLPYASVALTEEPIDGDTVVLLPGEA